MTSLTLPPTSTSITFNTLAHYFWSQAQAWSLQPDAHQNPGSSSASHQHVAFSSIEAMAITFPAAYAHPHPEL